MVLSVRGARIDDAGAIADLLTQLGYPTDAASVAPRLAALEAAGDDVIVAEQDGQVAGVARLHVAPSLERDRPVGQLAALVVDETRRGCGIGRALADAVEESARARGCGVLFLTTALRRVDAHAFYERVGFELTGQRYTKTLEE